VATALITGAASGIGRAVALRLASEGYVVAACDIDASAAYRIDVGRNDDVVSLVAAVERDCGPIDVVVNSAGILRMGLVTDITPEDWAQTFRVNVDGVFHVCRAVLPGMQVRKAGAIVNIASWFGKVGKPHFAAYCASKFAVIGLTQSLAMEVAMLGIRVNAVCPGTIAGTRMRDVADDGARRLGLPTAAERESAIPLGRAGRPEDVADVVAFLLSRKARYMTGQAINVTGGLWLG
jgi:NAD(P)-dependent dehydrogenase (short-subunit alcohol dehydrogenase family)